MAMLGPDGKGGESMDSALFVKENCALGTGGHVQATIAC